MNLAILNQIARQVLIRMARVMAAPLVAWLLQHNLIEPALGIQLQSILPEIIAATAIVLAEIAWAEARKIKAVQELVERERIALGLEAGSSPADVDRILQRERAITGST